MDTEPYSLSDSYVSINGGAIADKLSDVVGRHWYIFLGAIVVLTIIIILLLTVWRGKEKFNPTSIMHFMDNDQVAFSRKEHMDPSRGASYFAQEHGSSGINVNDRPGLSECSKKSLAGDDAWAWMNGVMQENMTSDKPKNDNDFSRVLSGQ